MTGLIVLACISLAFGLLFSFAGFMDPDSCWLVKMGLLILAHHALPGVDPFSFTLPMLKEQGVQQPFVVYQWLSEICFAAAYKIGNLNGLLVLCAVVSSLASICILFRATLNGKANLLVSFVLVALACGSVSVRLMVRPEIFTLLFIALWLFVIQRIRSAGRALEPQLGFAQHSQKFNLMTLALLTICWCNFHTGFVIGIITLAVYFICFLFEDFASRNPTEKFSARSKTAGLALMLCLVSTLCNPYGVGLWQYLPHLFFSPLNRYLDELLPISSALFLQLIYYPFFLLVVVSLSIAIVSIKRSFATGSSPAVVDEKLRMFILTGRMTSIVILFFALVVSIFCRRLLSPLSLFVAVETCWLASSLFAPSSQEQLSVFSKKRSFLFLELPVVLLSLAGVLLTSDRFVPLTMPQSSDTFQPPFSAVYYLLEHWKGGNIFNNLQTGSLLTMYGLPTMKIFADTQIDVYGEKILTDYMTILFAGTNYEALMQQYKIEWVIVSRKDLLAQALSKSAAWRKEFEDADALIFHKQ